jgi:DNA-binding CsgD family transcriptional regulator
MSAARVFHMTVREASEDGEMEFRVERVPERYAEPAAWFAEQFGLQALVVGFRRPAGRGAGHLLADWPLELIELSIRERWFDGMVIEELIQLGPHLRRPDEFTAHSVTEADQRRLRGRAAYGLPAPHVLPIWSRGAPVGMVSMARLQPFDPLESAVVEALAPALHASVAELMRARTVGALTSREIDCLRDGAAGRSAKETAAHLGVSEHTVISHLRRAVAKLGASNRPQAIAEAIRLGLLN